MDKKNFCFNEIEYSIVTGKRNYLEYYAVHRNSKYKKRVIISKGFSVSNDFEVLKKIAESHFKNNITNFEKPDNISKLHEYIYNQQYRLKPRTYTQFFGIVSKYVTWCISKRIVPHKISYSNVEQYVNHFSIGKKTGTIFNNVLVLKSVFNGLKKTNEVKENNFALLPKIKRSATSLAVFNTNQREAIKQYTMTNNKQLYKALLLVFSCGIRPNELRYIQVFDFDFEQGVLEIKGEDAKNGTTQKVHVPGYVLKEFEYIKNYNFNSYIFTKSGTPGTIIVHRNYLNNEHKKVLEILNIRGRYALYSWKHTGAVAMVRAGINIKLIQLQLRHSSLDMTNEYLKNLGITDNDDLKNKMPTL
jgi:integrase